MKNFSQVLQIHPIDHLRIENLEVWLALMLTLLGLYAGFSETLLGLWDTWMSDPLRSVGIFMPIAAAFFATKIVRDISWQGGRWWGLALMGLPILLFWLTSGNTSIHFLNQERYFLSVALMPMGLAFALYLGGAILLFGGMSAVRKLRFPLFLLLFVNPVPGIFSTLDAPLQMIAARVARGFAHLLSVPVEPGLLKLMFAPHLGMFIAPGCDGLRGAATMLCLSLIVGHVYRLSAARHTLFVVSAIVIAYAFNLIRLCCLILYYWLALRIDVIARLGTEIDYCIGGALFFCAALFIFAVPKRWA